MNEVIFREKENTVPGKLGCFMGVIFVLQSERGISHLVVKDLAGLGNVRYSAWLSVGSGMRSEAVCVIYTCNHIGFLHLDTQPG